MAEPQYELVDLSPDEATVIKKELEDMLEKHSIQFVVSPVIKADGRLSAVMNVLKKREAKQEGAVPSPAEFLPENGENPSTGSEPVANAS